MSVQHTLYERIVLRRSEGAIIATYTGPERQRIVDLFGSATLPTPFADMNEALAVVRSNHPGVVVEVSE